MHLLFYTHTLSHTLYSSFGFHNFIQNLMLVKVEFKIVKVEYFDVFLTYTKQSKTQFRFMLYDII